MNIKCLLTFLLMGVSLQFFAEDFSCAPEKPLPSVVINSAPSKSLVLPENSYGYFKGGTSAISPTIGVGYRQRDIESLRGNDYSLNIQFPLLSNIIPSFKYTRLFYHSTEHESRYFGLGIEALSFYIPNIQLIWGKEYEKVKYGQFELNLLPLIATPIILLFDEGHHSHYSNNPLYYLGGGLIATAAFVTYTVAF
ncbi:MAG: hypothetical protein K9M07_03040 [Simkaniaceae bacterium]|nr:hypothetical protein [Simkaniaceae bacterium]